MGLKSILTSWPFIALGDDSMPAIVIINADVLRDVDDDEKVRMLMPMVWFMTT